MANDNSVVVKVGDKVFIKGDQGYVFIPNVSETGEISWTNDGGLPNPTTRNIMGPEGQKGDTPNFSIGTVTTGDPGSPAAASITGTPENPVLNLTIPKGNTGEVTQAEFDEVADVVEAAFTVTDVSGNNLLNPANITTGYFYKLQTAAESEDNRAHIYLAQNNAYACAFVDVVEGQSYICSGTSYHSYNGDADLYAMGRASVGTTSTPSVVFDTTARVSDYNNSDKPITRVYFSWRHITYNPSTYMVNAGTTLLPYEEYIEPHEEISLKPEVAVSGAQIEGELGHVYTVDINGGGDYTSWTACIRALKDDTSRKTIYVHAGVYDIFTEIGGQTYAESISGQGLDWFAVSDVIPPNTKVIGLGEVVFEFKPTAEQIPADVASLLSPVNVIYDIYMENITIDSANCRYGLHDDTGHIAGMIETRHIYRNVKIRHAYTDRGMKPAFGCGFWRGQYFEFDGCDFQSSDRAWSFHNKGTTGGIDGTIIVIKNCIAVVDSGQKALRFGNVNGQQVKIDTRVFNTYIGGQIRIQDETSGAARPNAFALTVCGCGDPVIQIDSATNIYEPVVYQI